MREEPHRERLAEHLEANRGWRIPAAVEIVPVASMRRNRPLNLLAHEKRVATRRILTSIDDQLAL